MKAIILSNMYKLLSPIEQAKKVRRTKNQYKKNKDENWLKAIKIENNR